MSRGDIVFDCSAYRLPFEFVIRKRGNNGIGKYGAGVARRWLESLGIHIDRHHTFTSKGNRSFHPDFFDHTTGIAYEVKTGRHAMTDKTRIQLSGYEYAIATGQAHLVVYLIVAFEGEVGLAPTFREELRCRGFRWLVLK